MESDRQSSASPRQTKSATTSDQKKSATTSPALSPLKYCNVVRDFVSYLYISLTYQTLHNSFLPSVLPFLRLSRLLSLSLSVSQQISIHPWRWKLGIFLIASLPSHSSSRTGNCCLSSSNFEPGLGRTVCLSYAGTLNFSGNFMASKLGGANMYSTATDGTEYGAPPPSNSASSNMPRHEPAIFPGFYQSAVDDRIPSLVKPVVRSGLNSVLCAARKRARDSVDDQLTMPGKTGVLSVEPGIALDIHQQPSEVDRLVTKHVRIIGA